MSTNQTVPKEASGYVVTDDPNDVRKSLLYDSESENEGAWIKADNSDFVALPHT